MLKVCWISNIPSPYKVALMRLMAKDIEIIALFEKTQEKERDASWYDHCFDDLTVHYLNPKTYRLVLQEMAQTCDVLINADYTHSMSRYATKVFKKQNKPVCLLADGGLAIDRGLMNHIIAYFMKQCDYFLSSSIFVDDYFKFYHVPQQKIFHYRFSSLTQNDLIENHQLRIQKDTLKKEYGFKDEPILFSVGQQIPRKGVDILIEAVARLKTPVQLVIAGGNPEKKVLKMIEEKQMDNVIFVGFLNKEQLKYYYALSDIFVFPTRYDIWGLVVNEAMSFGLPIVSSRQAVASLHFEHESKNIILYDEPSQLCEKLEMLLHNESYRQTLSENALKGIQNYTIEHTASDLVAILKKVTQHA